MSAKAESSLEEIVFSSRHRRNSQGDLGSAAHDAWMLQRAKTFSGVDLTNPVLSPRHNVTDNNQAILANMRDAITQKNVKLQELRKNREWKQSLDKRAEQLEEFREKIAQKRRDMQFKTRVEKEAKERERREQDGSAGTENEAPPDDSEKEINQLIESAERRVIRKAEFRKWRAHTRLELARRIGSTIPTSPREEEDYTNYDDYNYEEEPNY